MNTSAALELKLRELETMQTDLAVAAEAVRAELEKVRRQERMNGAHRKAFDYEAEAARQRKAYAPIDWGAADRPPYTPIAWPTQPAQTDAKRDKACTL